MQRYNPKDIEPKWQKIWDETGTYTTSLQSSKSKYYAMSMFNYPSGAGIHIGHAMNYTISDVKARFKRQQGFESYHPIGWDAFGLPAENYAIKTGVSPQESMANIIPGYHKQYKAMGWSNDWEKEIATHLPEYYRWTQWIFEQMFNQGLAYQDARMQWWCPIDKTVLANEQVIDGKCWRHDGKDDPLAEKREIKQWFFKITDYADELLDSIDGLDWTDSVKLAQRNWIGKSVGAEIDFKLKDSDEIIRVFTTRPDTLFGATFMVIAPEHDLVEQIATKEQKTEVEAYVQAALKKSELERQSDKQKTGVFTGAHAINPVNEAEIPIWIADYVLGGYGTGAIMAVPAHDERDNEFAIKYDLPITQVVAERFIHVGNEPNKDAPLVPRKVVCAIVKHPTEDKILMSNPNGSDFWSSVMGGIDEGETAEQAAKRELAEESGYTDIKSIKVYDLILASEFFAQHKNENRIAYIQTVVIELNSLKQQAISDEEKTMQKLEWMSLDKANELWVGAAGKEILEISQGVERPMAFEGRLVNSGKFDGQLTSEARDTIVTDLAKKGVASEKVNYRMKDWSVSRQRYWGAPIPVIHCPKDGAVLVPEDQLPVILPEISNFEPTGDGRSALARAEDWLNVECPKCGAPAVRDTDTLDTYVDSSFYFYRYLDPHNQNAIFDSEQVKKWEPVDFYNGADHATAHLLYARFIGHFFKKLGLVNDPEPFKQFLFNGKVTASDGQMFSKSKGNGVDPLDIINDGYGADALRTYLMFAAPLELWAKWDPQGVPATYRFISRVWALIGEYNEAQEVTLSDKQAQSVKRAVNRMIKKVTEDLEANRYNTAIAAMMECTNDLYKLKTGAFGQGEVWHEALSALVGCMAPFAPHAAEELWHQLGHTATVHRDSWPKYDEQYLRTDQITIVVQINGKLRADIQVANDADEAAVVEAAKTNERVVPLLKSHTIKKTIYVPKRLVNFVI